MPELPEVEVTRLAIRPLVGSHLSAYVLRCPRLRYPLPREALEALLGQRLTSLERRAKYLLLGFETGALLLHLGMSGSLRLLSPDDAAWRQAQKHDHVDLVFESQLLRLRDPRRFGALLWLARTEDGSLRHPLLDSLGQEPLAPAFDAAWLHGQTRGSRSAIKPWLMNGRHVVGVGNIYAAESLFKAAIDPRLAAGRLSLARCARLAEAIRETLAAAIATGGSSLRDFLHTDGSSGYFQQQYFVYGRTGAACRQCGQPIRQLRQGQRSTFYCAHCQRR